MGRVRNGDAKQSKSATGSRFKNGIDMDLVKRCGRCMKWYHTDFFCSDRSRKCGCQSWCKRCKAKWELGPENVWRRLEKWLERNEPTSLGEPHGWTEKLYLERWAKAEGKCEACGSGLGEWQHSGHRLDRIDNDTPHIPVNCQMLCWVCNRRKSDKHPHVFKAELDVHLRDWGLGKIPWQKIENWARRVELPDPSPFIVEIQMSLLGDPA